MNTNKIFLQNQFDNEIDFFTLVTKYEEYFEMIKSAEKSGFNKEDINFFYFDNSDSNNFDGFSACNYALKFSKAKYIIFCHQDILFNFDTYVRLTNCINELNNIDPLWGVAGNAGVSKFGELKLRITDPHGSNQKKGNFPEQVISLDENFLIFNNKYNLSCTNYLKGFHMYGLDLCTNAISLGLNCYVIDFHLTHKSGGKVDNSFILSRKRFISGVKKRLGIKYFATTCTDFFVTSNDFLNIILNNRVVLKINRVILKFIGVKINENYRN